MDKIRFGIVGSGWRSLFYVRIAKALPQYFTLTGVLVRNEEKKRLFEEEHGVAAFMDRGAFLGAAPDFVVVAVSKPAICEVIREYTDLGMAVLAETPAALTVEKLEELWRLKQEGARIQVAEQYFLFPTVVAKLEAVHRGYLGELHSADLSYAHDYHAASLFRRFLNTGMEKAVLRGEKYTFPVVDTDTRDGITYEGKVVPRYRNRVTIEYESGRVGFYDFSGVSYHSYIRNRHIRVQGQRGELEDEVLCCAGAGNEPVKLRLEPMIHSSEGGIVAVAMGEHTLYRNPFDGTRLNEDEIAIASLLLGMKKYLEEGTEVYPLAEALQDAYFSILMKEAFVNPGKAVASERMIWN